MADRPPYRRRGNEMDLPAGSTCGVCAHFRRCSLIYGRGHLDEVCDWLPSRFRAEPLDEEPRYRCPDTADMFAAPSAGGAP